MSGPNMRAVIRTNRLLAELGLNSPIEALEELAKARKDAARYQWLRDRNDWYAEPRLDDADGTKWELCFYTPQRITDPTDDDNLDAAIDAAMSA
jgi:hypothetical protein